MAYPAPTDRFSRTGKNLPVPMSGIEITLKPDQVIYGDFLPPALLPEGERDASEAPGTITRVTLAEGRRHGLRQPTVVVAATRRGWRPPRLPEPIYAVLRRMAVEVVCCGFVGIVVLTLFYRLARTALH